MKKYKKFTGTVPIKIDVKIWTDKVTGAIIYYSKMYDVSGYGETSEKAAKMFEFQVKQILLDTKNKKA